MKKILRLSLFICLILPWKSFSKSTTDSSNQSTGKLYQITAIQLRNIVSDRMKYDSLLVRYNELLLIHANYQKGIEASQKAFELSDQNANDYIRVAEIDNKVIRRKNLQIIWQKVRAPVLGIALFYLGNRSVSWGIAF
ncbi:hypothetical protein [Flectobacillus rivi]|uniref:Tetratricopeptide repeat protein n=1 Tax=Flectobacillus rivi TaxID=2984209 RepID=A0ABT6Z1E7_9BACT|nr:hypothetical protein [Flectobacillus rivi]MDI9874965.1 hypothetical protein [Flectobacillus rivi]